MTRPLFDTAQQLSTPAAGHNADLEARIGQLGGLVNEHAVDLDTLDGNIGGTLTADADGRAKIAAGFFDAATVDSAFAVNTIGQELLEAELDATAMANVPDIAVSPTSSEASFYPVMSIQHADHATETLIYKTTRKIQIVGLTVLKSAAGAANTVQLTDSADAAITDAVAADTDKAVTRAATIDPAKSTVAAGGTFKAVYTRAAGSSLMQLLVHVLPRA